MRWYHVQCINESVEGIWNCPSCRTLPSVVQELITMVKSLQDEFTAYKLQSNSAIDELKNECQQLRRENKALQELVSTPLEPKNPATNDTRSFADVVKSSVQTVLREEKVKSDVILINVNDAKQDSNDIKELCSEIGFPTQPVGVQRLGKPQTNRPRLLKVTFGSVFDARAFQAKFLEAKKEDHPKTSGVRCRPGRTKAEQENFTKLSKAVYNLNKDAKPAGNESFSLRPNGQVWKFAKDEEGRWKRVTDWTYTPVSPAQGNSSQPPTSQD